MEQELKSIISEKNGMIQKGQIVEATDRFFASNAVTKDFDGTLTNNKSEMINKMEQFVGAISQVNGITLHNVSVSGDVTFSEYTFDFDMKDGSHILWHEIIRSVWKDGLIVEEEYFKGF